VMFDPHTSQPDAEKGRSGGGREAPHGRRPGLNNWNPPDGRVTGSAGGGSDRSCMAVAAPVAITIGTLLAVAIRGLR
jgi:hypothetical protein